MNKLTWWMRIVGAVYLLQFVMMAVVRAPIQTFGPEGALLAAASGDPLAKFLVDTWVGFGLENCAIGIGLLLASRSAETGRALVWTVLAVELAKGIVFDFYMIVRGYDLVGFSVWIVIHSVIIVTGLLSLRKTQTAETSAHSPKM